jgi:putative ABC transport system permease protein
VSRTLRRASRRFLLRHPTQSLLALVGIALGVAGAVAIALANDSATRAFSATTDAVAGRATHQITAGPAGLPDELPARLVRHLGPGRVAPIVEGRVTTRLPTGGRRALQLLGVDPFSEAPFRPQFSSGGDTGGGLPGLDRLVTAGDTAALAAATAAELGVGVGDRLEIEFAGRQRSLEIVALLDSADPGARQAFADLLVLDLAAAQETLDRVGRLDRIDLRLADVAGELSALLPPDARVESAAARSRTLDEMTRAFRFNLTALSYLAVFCGAFLIYNATSFAVVQRRRLLGMLRALGVTRREILALVLGEAALLGLVGSALGLALGTWLAQGLVVLVTRTINDLYFNLTVRGAGLDGPSLALGLVLGLGATLLAALPPALEASAVAPGVALARSSLESKARRGVTRAAGLGVLLGALGALLLLAPSRGLPLAFAGFFATVLGAALLVPGATVLLLRWLGPVLPLLGTRGRLATRGVVTSLSRTGVALAALTVAVAVTVGVGVMIASFRQAVVHWLEGALVAEIYVSPPGGRPGEATVVPAALAALAADPAVAEVSLLRHGFVTSEHGPLRLLASDLAASSRDSWRLVAGDREPLWSALEAGAVAIAAPFAYRAGLGVGDVLRLPTRAGPQDFPIVGIFEDYSADRGAVLISREVYRRLWGDDGVSAVGIDLVAGSDAEAVVGRLRAATAPFQALDVRATGTLKRNSLQVFDRTFAVTAVLRAIAGLVAFVGVVSALGALALDRARELGVLRALGLTPGELGGLVTVQSGLLGLIAGLFSLPLGMLLAAIMVHVINRRSFGWSLELVLPVEVLAQAVLLAFGAALLAGLQPAWKMAHTSPALALREE